MKQVKSFIASKTIWGVILMIAGSIFGYNIPEGADQELAGIASVVMESVGAVLALYGRIKADKKITVVGN